MICESRCAENARSCHLRTATNVKQILGLEIIPKNDSLFFSAQYCKKEGKIAHVIIEFGISP